MEALIGMLKNDMWFIRNNPLILKKWHPNVNLLKEDVGRIPVWVKLHGVPVTAFSKDGLSAIATKLAFSKDGLSAIATKLGTTLMLDSYTFDMYMHSWGKSSYARVVIELRADVELKDNIVFGHTIKDCPKNIGAGVTKNLKKTRQAPKGIPRGVDSTNKVSDSNPFEVLNSVDIDVEMGTNRGTSNVYNNGANSSGSLFWNVENSSTSTTPIMDKIKKFENLIIDRKAMLMDKAGNPLKRVEYPGDHDSEDEVASDDNDMARSLASEKTGFSTQKVVPKVDDVSLADEVFEGTFGRDGEEDFAMGEGVVVSSSLLDMSTKSCLSGIM
nr:hypothetical protein [Tanacetum cinerariifolium]